MARGEQHAPTSPAMRLLTSQPFLTLVTATIVIWACYRLYDSNMSALENAVSSFKPLPPNGTFEEVLKRVHLHGDVLSKASNDISLQRLALVLLEISTPYMGLPAPLRVLQSMEPRVFALTNRTQLAQYADAVTKAAAGSVGDATRALGDGVPPNAIGRANVCSVGNLAYLALNAPTPELKARADEMLEVILVARRYDHRRNAPRPPYVRQTPKAAGGV